MSETTILPRFTTVDLVKKLDTVKAAALREPIAVTEHRKAKFVLMTVADYERLRGSGNPHRAFRAAETPDFILDIFKDDLAPRAGDER
jgi:hypothetical protein